MKNFWLDKYRIGRRVRYIGDDSSLYMKCGVIVDNTSLDCVGVQFDIIGFISFTKVIVVKKENLQVI